MKKIEKNEKGKGKKKDEKEEDGRPRLPTPPRVPPRLPTPPRVPSSGSDGWRGCPRFEPAVKHFILADTEEQEHTRTVVFAIFTSRFEFFGACHGVHH